ncbi:uncharacterized protein PRCAT00002384001 [Priceomyces carsonii]|uniref:uncharacterized protein n=1 Tax=Priceomyces carsonii TaxID=28549 RepID=UPI002EDBAC99|nr:unnamed protein product [Priceomyces carsonii]
MFRTTPQGILNNLTGSVYAKRLVSYSLPKISLLENLKISNGDFKGLYSNRAVNEIWFKRGEQLVAGLNQSLEVNQLKNPPSNLESLIAGIINKPELYGLLSYASLLHNLQFALESLRPNDAEFSNTLVKKAKADDLLKSPSFGFVNEPLNEDLKSWLIDSFGSITEFRTLLLNSAKAINGDGYTWLVAESNLSENSFRSPNRQTHSGPTYSNLAIVNTYNAGVVDDTLRSGQLTKLKMQKAAKLAALKKKMEERRNIENEEHNDEYKGEEEEDESAIENDLLLGSVDEAEASILFNDRKLLPLLAIDASSRNYLLDYGVFGKQFYLDNLWECIDWDVVASRSPSRTQQFVKLD